MKNIIKKRLNNRFSSRGYNNCIKPSNYAVFYVLRFATRKPADLKYFGLIPELIGRFPIITQHELSITQDTFNRIMIEPKNALIKQYQKHIRNGLCSFKDHR